MPGPTMDAAAAACIRARLAAERVDASYAVFVARHLTVPDAGWRWCCGSHCDPCVQALGRVVDAVRQTLGIGPAADADGTGASADG
ncbi:MAG: hypothetical protein KF830_16765 [Planctomycetes bacterium]|nr:hypothetical protein [Planctomycetota bacterium]